MRIGSLIDVDRPLDAVVAQVRALADAGLAHAWAVQIFGFDALTLLALVGREVPGIGLGTAVVPVYPRHPQVLAQQALTVQAATGDRLLLGIGLSHQVVVEGMWGYRFERPARYMAEYLAALLPMLGGEAVRQEGEMVTARTPGPLDVTAAAPPVLVAALGPTMLRLAGRVADGTVTWMTGLRTVRDHIVPTIAGSAADAGRPAPSVAVSLPVVVADDPAAALQRIDDSFSLYPSLPSYAAMLEREGATRPSEISLVGDEAAVRDRLLELADAGATDFLAAVVGDADERRRTLALLSEVALSG